MLPDPKKIAIGILAKGKPDGDGPDAEGGGDPLEEAAQDFLDAVKSDSAKDLADAFRSMLDLAG